MPSANKLVRVLTALYCEPWLITPQMHKTLCDIAGKHAAGGDIEAAQHEVAAAMKAKPAKRDYAVVEVEELDEDDPRGRPKKLGDVAVIPVEGVIGRKFSRSLYSSGVTSIDVFERLVRTAAEDEQVDAITLLFDSPGGLVMGVPEAARAIAWAREAKPVIAFADGLMDSAAYWLASQTDAVYATESADVGSVGVYIALLDSQRWEEMQGFKTELFKSGRFKGMGYPGTSLSDEQREMLQGIVDDVAAKFKAAVARGRGGQVPDEAMQGQSFGVEEALVYGLIDSVTDAETAIRDAARLARIRGMEG